MAEPARAPAAMDSSVESCFFPVDFWKNARENSYPADTAMSGRVMRHGQRGGRLTVVVNEVGDGNAKQSTVQTRVETYDALAVDDALGCTECASRRLLLLHLRSGREGDQRVSAPSLQYCPALPSSASLRELTSMPWRKGLHLLPPARAPHYHSAARRSSAALRFPATRCLSRRVPIILLLPPLSTAHLQRHDRAYACSCGWIWSEDSRRGRGRGRGPAGCSVLQLFIRMRLLCAGL